MIRVCLILPETSRGMFARSPIKLILLKNDKKDKNKIVDEVRKVICTVFLYIGSEIAQNITIKI